jgi:NhaP-type Na+/H+ or K+/H+ antiporter
VVIRLIVLGAAITWALAAALAAPLLGMSRGAAVMLGVILVVSGPTVVGPLLGFVRPTQRLQRVLIWEGSSTSRGPGSQFAQFLVSVGVGLAGGVVGTALLWLLLRKIGPGEVLGTSAQLAAVVAVAAGCDALRDDSGLIAAIFMGLALANVREFDIPARRPFFETLVQLIIGVLFISIPAQRHDTNRHDCREPFGEGPEPTAAEPAAGCAPAGCSGPAAASGPAAGGGPAAVAGAAAGLGVNLAERT